MQFTVPVPSNVSSLQFSWQSLTTYALPYVISFQYELDQKALNPPELSIPFKGFVPQSAETFMVNFFCTGNVSAQVPIEMNIYVRGPPRANDTKITFKRNKICIKGEYPTTKQSPAHTKVPSQGLTLLGAAACAIGLALVIGLIASAMYVRTRKQIRQDSLHLEIFQSNLRTILKTSSIHHTSFTTAAYGSHQNVFIRLDPLGRPPSVNSGSYATIASLNKFPLMEAKKFWYRKSPTPSPYATALLPDGSTVAETIYAKPESVCPSRISYYASSQLTQIYSSSPHKMQCNNIGNLKDKVRSIHSLPSGVFCCGQLLYSGTYARVYKGKFGDACDVLIKTIMNGASLTQVTHLLSEASILIGTNHQNVLTPLAANKELTGPPKIAYTYPSKGNLKTFLQKSKESSAPLSTRQLVEFALQVTKGLAHLHSIGIIHKDIATRNCFLDKDCNVKICDGALTRDLFPDDYHCLGDNENRPIKWMALETLQKKYYSVTSDIWSLGVLFWELATLASAPFFEVDAFELTAYLRDGYRLGQPINCPDEFYTVMSCCWLEDSAQRPSFSQLLAYLQDFHEDLGKYI